MSYFEEVCSYNTYAADTYIENFQSSAEVECVINFGEGVNADCVSAYDRKKNGETDNQIRDSLCGANQCCKDSFDGTSGPFGCEPLPQDLKGKAIRRGVNAASPGTLSLFR